MNAKEFAMRPSRFLMMAVVLSAVLLLSDGVSLTQAVTYPYSFTGQNGLANPAYGTLAQGRNANLYGAAAQLSGEGSIFRFATAGDAGTLFAFDYD